MPFDEKVDLVYTWVDGNDPKHRAKRMAKMKELGIIPNEDVNGDCRFISHDELKYSLRSVEKYANWINNIFIITDGQVPEWLDTNNPRIHIVDHKDILPEYSLPCFNSNAIELCMWKIPELSEFFLYNNDDYFFGSKIEKSDFFDFVNRKCINYCRIGEPGNKSFYLCSLRNAQNVIKNVFGKHISLTPSHGTEAHLKSAMKECYEEIKSYLRGTFHSNFRDLFDVNYFVYILYYYLEDLMYLKKIKRTSFLVRILRYFGIKKWKLRKFSKILDMDKDYWSRYNTYDVKCFCVNDTDGLDERDRAKIKPFFEAIFPDKSSFEK